MSGAPRRKGRRYAALFASMLCGAIASLYPIESTICPAWTIQVVDQNGQPLGGAFVRQIWQHYSVESTRHEQDAPTDANGYVSFPERTVRASILSRVLGAIVNMLTRGVHAGYGPHTYVIAYGKVVNEKRQEGSISYSSGMALPKQLVTRIHDLGFK